MDKQEEVRLSVESCCIFHWVMLTMYMTRTTKVKVQTQVHTSILTCSLISENLISQKIFDSQILQKDSLHKT
jgi:hypothetical protein